MHYKKEPCRNFQRGSCQYGERCKFLHVTQPKSNAFGFGTQAGLNQQQKPNPFGFGAQAGLNQQQKPNPFGFGAQASLNQQQKPNPFGFGVQNNAQSKGTNDYANKQSQFKNTWTRSSASNYPPSSRQSDNQPQSTNHKCTDPESCKRIIAEDFEQEKPLWNLTCYGHWKNLPCDIIGDISYEELRAAAYDEAKQGISLQSVVERERNLLNSKLIEFQNLLHNPYKGPAGSVQTQQSPFHGATATGFTPAAQNSTPPHNGFPPSVSSFSQLGASLNTGSAVGPSQQSNNAFGQPVSFSSPTQASNTFPTNNLPLANAFSFGNQQYNPSVASSFTTNTSNFSNTGVSTTFNQFSAPAASTQGLSSFSFQPQTPTIDSNSNIKVDEPASTDVQLGNNLPKKIVSGDSSIWLKEKWVPGEIPEEAPPDAYV